MTEEIREAVDEGEMPLWYYRPTHPDARITAQDRSAQRVWAGGDENHDED